MEVGESAVSLGEHAELGPVRITLHQHRVSAPTVLAQIDLSSVLNLLEQIRDTVVQIERNTRPCTLWERIKQWLGIH